MTTCLLFVDLTVAVTTRNRYAWSVVNNYGQLSTSDSHYYTRYTGYNGTTLLTVNTVRNDCTVTAALRTRHAPARLPHRCDTILFCVLLISGLRVDCCGGLHTHSAVERMP